MTTQDKPKDRLPKVLLLAGLVVLVLVVIGAIAFTMMSRNKAEKVEVAEPVSEVAQATDTAPQNEWIEWEESQPVSNFHVAGYDIAFAAATDDGLKLPVITVTDADGKTVTIRGEASGSARAEFAVVQMDASSPARQILFSSYSGGAHCCVVGYMIEPVNGGLRTVPLKAWDGDRISLPRDVDGDGRKEFVMFDQSFLYAFSAYAYSNPPRAIYSVVDGKFEDVSTETKYRSLYVEDLNDMRQRCREGGNGPCAGFAAAAARAGQLDAAWPIVLASTRTDDWSNPAPCKARGVRACDLDQQNPYPTYAESLQWFLGEEGYTPKVFEARDKPEGPSFSCASARTAAERMICNNADLRQIDVRMAVAYTRAHALLPNRQALREAQTQFLRERNAISDPKLMLEAYNQRIQMLERL